MSENGSNILRKKRMLNDQVEMAFCGTGCREINKLWLTKFTFKTK